MLCRTQAGVIRVHHHIFGTYDGCLTSFHFSELRNDLQIGSALCGAAQNMIWLVVCRAVQGIGGGGIIQMVQITISDIVSLQE